MATSDRHQSRRGLLLQPRHRADHARAGLWPHREYRLHRRQGRQPQRQRLQRFQGGGHRADQIDRQGARQDRHSRQLRHAGGGQDGDLRSDNAAAHRFHAVQDPARPFRGRRGNRGDSGMAVHRGLLVFHRCGIRRFGRPRDVLIHAKQPVGPKQLAPAVEQSRFRGLAHAETARLSVLLGNLFHLRERTFMKFRSFASRAIALFAAGLFLFAGVAHAAEVKVMISGGFSAAYRILVPEFRSATGNTVATASGPSMGNTPEAIPNRLSRGERGDVMIMVGSALDDLIKEGKVLPGSRVDLARAKIGMAVRAGAAKPDIGTVEALKRTLLAAKSIAYSDSASGVYLSTVPFPKLGVAEQIAGKSRMIPAEPVGLGVGRGEFEVGFQQISELRPVKGIDIVGPLPSGAQRVTVFAAGIPATATHPEAAKALIQWLASPAAYAAIKKSGLEPANSK